jgi:hypothetical protein
LSHVYQRYCCPATPIKHPNQALPRTYFILAAALIYIAVTNGTSLFKVLFIATVNYGIAMTTKGSYFNPFLTWTWNLLVLFANEWNNGYQYKQIGEAFAFLVS